MKERHGDIQDDEIRIITSGNGYPEGKRRSVRLLWLCGMAALLLVGLSAVMFFSTGDAGEGHTTYAEKPLESAGVVKATVDSVPREGAFTVRRDIVINGVELEILTPHHAVPTLAIGNDVCHDASAVLVVQAADIRGDNGAIVGSFVVKGNLISKSEAKAGFCAIINGKITVGVADATPMFEQALLSDGYFFRQYPLVVGGQIVENKPKGKALRKALAEADGEMCVILSRNRVTYHDFSQALADVGVRNAIALVGGDSFGSYTDAESNKFTFGHIWDKGIEQVNYMVWR